MPVISLTILSSAIISGADHLHAATFNDDFLDRDDSHKRMVMKIKPDNKVFEILISKNILHFFRVLSLILYDEYGILVFLYKIKILCDESAYRILVCSLHD